MNEMKTETQGTQTACCHATAATGSAAPPQGQRHGGSSAALAGAATLHCLTGCLIGEFFGLSIGVSLGLGAWATIVLATALSYVSGFTLGLLPLIRRGLGFLPALRTIWLGEAISIAVMEFAMNFADYHVGGMNAYSMADPMFWLGLAVAVPAGFLAAWPVNWWLLERSIKQPCH